SQSSANVTVSYTITLSLSLSCRTAIINPFPTRRSSDLANVLPNPLAARCSPVPAKAARTRRAARADRHGRAGTPFFSSRDARGRSEEHTSELQSQSNLVCRLLLEKKEFNTNEFQYSHTS